MHNSVRIDVLGLSSQRETVPVFDGATIRDLAVGATTHRMFVRGPSGKAFVVVIPAELEAELAVALSPANPPEPPLPGTMPLSIIPSPSIPTSMG